MIGNEYIKNYFRKAIAENNLAHAYLFFGPQSLGKHTFALELAGHILEAQSLNFHPDFINVNNNDSSISLDTIRELKRFFSLSKIASYKIAIINNAHNLTREASNAFLKLLEEAPTGSIIFLITHLPAKLVTTILSRLVQIRFKPLNKEELVSVLKHFKKNMSGIDLDKLLDLACGSPGDALRLFDSTKIFEKHKMELEKLRKSDLINRLMFAKVQAFDKDQLQQKALNWMRLIHALILEDISALKGTAPRSILDLYSAIVDKHINHRFALESWLVNLG